MIRRSALLAVAASLTVPATADAFIFRPYYCPPPVVVYYAPPIYILPPFAYGPAIECAPAAPVAPPKVMEQPAPKAMEKPAPKVEAPKPKDVVPAAATEPMKEKPKGELAVPVPAVPAEKPKDVPVPFVLPPEKKKDEKPDAGLPTIPKLNVPLATPESAVPKIELPAVPKKDEPKLPEFKLPPIVSESKYLPKESFDVRVVPVEGKRAAGNQTVKFYNYTDRELSLVLDDKSTAVPAKSLLSVALPDSFAWSLGGKSETATIPADAAGLSVIIK